MPLVSSIHFVRFVWRWRKAQRISHRHSGHLSIEYLAAPFAIPGP